MSTTSAVSSATSVPAPPIATPSSGIRPPGVTRTTSPAPIRSTGACAHGVLEAHARDELGITEALRARPLQASLASAAAFSVGAALPLATAALVPGPSVLWAVGAATVATLLVLGGLAASAGGAPVARGARRVVTWGVLAMAATAAVGRLVGVAL